MRHCQTKRAADGTGGFVASPEMTKHSPFRHFKTSPEIIRLAVMLYVRFPLSLRNVEGFYTNVVLAGCQSRAVERVEQIPCNLRNATAV